MDWKKIKSEYITDENSSYTKLSKKYNVSRSTIANKAGREGWASDKERYQNELVTKTIASVQKKEIDKITRIQGLTDRLLDKLEKAINELDIHQIKNSIKTKVIEYNNIERPDKPTKEVIEEKEEMEFLKQAGCDMGQGYYFSKPIPADLFAEKYFIAM